MIPVKCIVVGSLASAVSIASAQSPFILERDAAYQVAFGDQFYGALASGPGEYFAVWVDLRVGGANAAGYDLYAQRIRPDGSVAHPGSLMLLRDSERMTSGIPAVAWNGSVYLVVWYEGDRLFGMRVGAGGEVLDPEGFLIDSRSGNQGWPAVAGGAGGFLVVQGDAGSILVQRVAQDGIVLDPTPNVVSIGADALGYPQVAYGAGEYMVAWAEAPDQAIRAARVSTDGEVYDFGGVNISGGGVDVDAAIDFDGVTFFVNWQRRDGGAWDFWGVHVSSQGVPGTPRLLLDGNSWGPVSGGWMAFNGTHHIISITTGEPVYSNSDLYAMLVDPSGHRVGDPFPVSTIEGRSQTGYGAAAVGDQFFLLWEGNRLPGVYYVYDTEGARVTGDGLVLDRPDPIAVSTGAAWQTGSATSFDGSNHLCVFEDWRAGPDDYPSSLYAVRVTPDGRPVEDAAFKIADAAGWPREPDSVFGGGQHVVVFEHNDGAVSQVRLARILPDGTNRDPDGILVFSNEPTGEVFRPKVAWNGTKYCVAWYDNYLPAGQEPLQFALVRVDGSIERGATVIPNSDFASLIGFELASNGDEFLLAWVGYDRVHATRISSAGAVLGTQTVQTTGSWITELTELAFNGESYLAAWTKWGDEGVSIYARRIAANGVPLGSTMLLDGPFYHAATLDVLSHSSDFIVIGARNDGPPEWIGQTLAIRIDAAGNVLGAPDAIIAPDRDEVYASASFAMGPGAEALGVFSLWADMPYNGPRAQGLVFRAGGACAADLNGDGTLTIFDFLVFQSLFSSEDPRADLAPPAGVLNVFDFLAFQAAFGEGC